MTCKESLQDWMARNRAQREKLLRAADGLSDDQARQRPDPQTWSPAEVLEHLVLAHRPYLLTIKSGIANAKRADGDPPMQHSFFGKLIIWSVKPGTNYPAPKMLHPSANPLWSELLPEWERQYEQLLGFLESAEGADLSATRVRNPFVSIARQNLADCFEIVTAHTERHVGQIEQRITVTAVARTSAGARS